MHRAAAWSKFARWQVRCQSPPDSLKDSLDPGLQDAEDGSASNRIAMSRTQPAQIHRLPVVLQRNTAVRAQDGSSDAPRTNPGWTDQIGIPELSAQREGGESGEKRPGSYAAIATDPEIILRRADSIAFTVSHNFLEQEEPAGVGLKEARVFPPDQERIMEKAGRRLFEGVPPRQAMGRASIELLKFRVYSRPTLAQEIMSSVDQEPEFADRRWLLTCIEDDALTVASLPNVKAVAALERCDWRETPYPALSTRQEVEDALLEHETVSARFGKMDQNGRDLWGGIAGSSFHAERKRLALSREALDRELSQAARTWQRHFRNYYSAEDDALPDDTAGNPHLQVNQPQLLFRQLAPVWPDNAIWPASSWPTVPENFLVKARHAEGKADRGALAAIRREATVRAAVGRILRLGDEYRSAPRERGGSYVETAVDRILQGQDFMATVGKDVPEAATGRFAELVFRYCRNLERDRNAAHEISRLGVKVIVSQPDQGSHLTDIDIPG